MFVLVAFLLLLRKSSSCAAPVFPQAVYEEAVYEFIRRDTGVTQNACTGRSTLNILWSCLATTFACTWVSVHPNIPFFGHNKWAVRRWRVFLMFLALLAPEIMIMWAMKQLQGALTIKETVNKYIQSHTSNSANSKAAKPKNIWSMTHAHYLQMGGFRLRLKLKEENGVAWQAWQKQRDLKVFQHSFGCEYNDEDHLDLTLTLESFKAAVNESIIDFPDISEEEIEDKNGRDALSKSIAMLQLLWFVLQIAARSRQKLAITELEMTTAALAILNIGMYIAWWKKPTDISCPTIIYSKDHRSGSDSCNFGENVKVNIVAYYWTVSVNIVAHSLEAIMTFMKSIFTAIGNFFAAAIHTIPSYFTDVIHKLKEKKTTTSNWHYYRSIMASIPKFMVGGAEWILFVFLHIFQVLIYYPLVAILSKGTPNASPSHDKKEPGASGTNGTNETTPPQHNDIIADLSGVATIQLLSNGTPNASPNHDFGGTGTSGDDGSNTTTSPQHNKIVVDLSGVVTMRLLSYGTPNTSFNDVFEGPGASKTNGTNETTSPQHNKIVADLSGVATIRLLSNGTPNHPLSCDLREPGTSGTDVTKKATTSQHYKNVAVLSGVSTIRLLFKKDTPNIRLSMQMIFASEDVDSVPFFYVSAFSGMLFGMIHCLAWDFDTPSRAERLLWRVSSLSVVGLCFFMLIVGLIYDLERFKIPHFHDSTKIVTCVRVVSSFIYVSSRLLLLTLSFLSLRALPDSALDTVQWSLFIPHI